MSAELEVLRQVASRLPRVPPRLTRWIHLLERAPSSAHPRLAAAVGLAEPALDPLLPSTQEVLCPAYPAAPRATQARLALGERPTEVLRGLTRREAHDALSEGWAGSSAAWLVREVPGCPMPRTVAVARWVLACWADPQRRAALERERQERGPGGVEVHGRLLERVDEISARDLHAGTKTGVEHAFAAAAARLYEAWEKGAESDEVPLAPRPRWWKQIRCAHLLDTPAALVREGRAMHHCVGTYAPVVKRSQSCVVSIAIATPLGIARSTAELDRRTLEVRQHKGERNQAPPEICKRALASCLLRWRSRAV